MEQDRDTCVEDWQAPHFDLFLQILRARIIGDSYLRSVEKTEQGIVFEILSAQSREVERVLVPWRILQQIRGPYRLASRRVLKPNVQA